MSFRSKHPPRTGSAKEAIRDAAAALFAEKGFAATSTREICQRAGITKPVLYYYFGNKVQLYEELVLDTYNDYQKELRRAARHGRTPNERLINVLSAMFSFARHRHNYWRVGFRMVLAPEKESPTINYVEMSQADERLLAEIIREGVRRGEMKGRPEFIAGAIVGMAISSILGFLLTGQPPLDRSLAKRTIALLTKGCGVNSTYR
ncbi:MAG: TetR/AcrR family transcriptional regulator [Acidobacteriia bacterium]|nr:TetR/AcrR family transcriptional regulator [Terriglobia bacterium]